MDGGSGFLIQAVKSRGQWRVRMAWGPRHPARYFGKFHSEAEAEQWIAEHSWLTKRQVDPPPETTEPQQSSEVAN
jgi:hypothetical protein